jgi:hypothetical protein
LDDDLAPVASQQVGGRSWDLYATALQGFPVDIGLALDEGEDVIYVVMLFSHEAERDGLYEAVFLPALAAIDVDA